MTLAELKRAIESKLRRDKLQAQERAVMDYILAALIGDQIGRRFTKNDTPMPTVEEIYPSLFVEENKAKQEEKVKKQDELSALRFKQYADFYNKKYKEVAKTNDK